MREELVWRVETSARGMPIDKLVPLFKFSRREKNRHFVRAWLTYDIGGAEPWPFQKSIAIRQPVENVLFTWFLLEHKR
jgi:hypothetical protein